MFRPMTTLATGIAALACLAGPVALAADTPVPAGGAPAAAVAPAPAPSAVAPAPAPAAVPNPAPVAATEARKDAPVESKVTGPTFAGFVNLSYNYDLNDPASGMTQMRVYDVHHNSFELNSAHVAMTGAAGDASYAVETDFGHDAAIHKSSGFGQTLSLTATPSGDMIVDKVTGGAPTVDTDVDTFDVQEAYVSFPDPILSMLGLKATVKAGKFVTYEGIEVIESNGNPTISRGYLFGYAEPYTHIGGAMTVTIGSIAVTGGVVNGWDRLIDDNKPKMGLANINIGLGNAGMVNLTGYSGAEGSNAGKKKNSIDLTGVLKVLPMTDLWYQVNYGDEEQLAGGVNKWGGAALEPLIHFSDAWTLGLRGEYFDNKPAGLAYGKGAATFVNATAALGWTFMKNTTMRLEFRHDESASSAPWDDSAGVMHHRTNTLSHELVMTF